MDLSVPARVEACVYRVVAADGGTAGTAFAVGPDGLLVTCTHVLQEAGAATSSYRLIRFATGERCKARIIKGMRWPANREDVAFLRLYGSLASPLPYLDLSPYPTLSGASLYSYGFPEGRKQDGMPGRCRVVGPAREAGQPLLAISSGEVSVGFSGGPAVDEESGLVAGMVTAIAIADSYGKNAKSAFLAPASTLIRLNPMAAVGTDRTVQDYRQLMRLRGESPTYSILGLTGIATSRFVPPALREEFRETNAGPSSVALPLDRWLAAYDDDAVSQIYLVGGAGSGKSAVLRAITLGLVDRGRALPVLVSAKALSTSGGLGLSEMLAGALRSAAAFGGDLQLPTDFLSQWSARFGHRFVVLIDGCDEITDLRERNLFLQGLKDGIAPFLVSAGHSLVIASREVDELGILEGTFRRVVVDPLPEASREALIESVLGARGPDFNAYLLRFENRTLLFSPLVLQLLLALCLAGRLKPMPSLTAIYDAYFREVEAQWRRRGLAREGAAADHARDILSIVAWHEINGARDLEEATEASAEFLARQLHLREFGARATARRMIEFLGTEGGIVRDAGASLQWVHGNFRDFLAARAICELGHAVTGLENCDLKARQLRIVLDRWDDASGETFARFVLAMSSEPGLLDEAVETLLPRGDAALCFLARALGDGAPMPADTVSLLSGKLTKAAVTLNPCRGVFIMDSANPAVALHRIVWLEPFFSAGVDLLRKRPKQADAAGIGFQEDLAHAILRSCSMEQLEQLRTEASFKGTVRDILHSAIPQAAGE